MQELKNDSHNLNTDPGSFHCCGLGQTDLCPQKSGQDCIGRLRYNLDTEGDNKDKLETIILLRQYTLPMFMQGGNIDTNVP